MDKFGIETIDATTIRSFLGYLKDTPNRWDSVNTRANRPVSPTTVKSYYIGLSALFTWAMEEELIQVNPMANVKKPKLPNKIVKGLESEIIITLLNAFSGRSFNDLRNKAMLLMFLDTGLRLSELASSSQQLVHQRAEAVAQTHSALKAVQGIIQPSKLLFKPYD